MPQWQSLPTLPQPDTTRTLRPLVALLPERTSPELLYLETKCTLLAAYGLTAELLHEVLPTDRKHSAITVRNHTLRAARHQRRPLWQSVRGLGEQGVLILILAAFYGGRILMQLLR